MLALPKKPTVDKSSSGSSMLQWRPDFRDISSLPDTKTVRTSFFVNTVAAALVGALTLYVAQREWTRFTLGRYIADLETRTASVIPASDKAQVLFKLFLAEEKRFNDAYALVKEPFRVTDFVVHIGEILPEGVLVKRIDYKSGSRTVSLSGTVRGLDATATDMASRFEKQLQDDEYLAQHFASVRLTNAGRNLEEGCLNLELVFTFKTIATKTGSLK